MEGQLQEWQLYTDSYEWQASNWDLNELLRLALMTSYNHDKKIKTLLKTALLQPEQSWVITQYNIQIVAPFFVAEQVKITTQVIEANRFFVTRQFTVEMNNNITHRILAQFAVLDLSTRKMARVPMQELHDLNLIVPISAKLSAPKPLVDSKWEMTQTQTIQAKDIDENHHVNNRVYLRWAFAALPEQFVAQHRLTGVQIKYGSELRAEDAVEVRTNMNQNETYQTITNLTLTKDACYVKMSWEQIEGGN